MSKAKIRREQRYRAQLKACGFRSWKAANLRRGELIDVKVYGKPTDDQAEELRALQILADLYVQWKTDDLIGRMNRKLEREFPGVF